MSAIDLKSTQFEPGAPLSEGMIPLCVPEIRGNEWAYIKECLDTNWVSSAGPFVTRFEQALADYVGTQHAVAVVNGTAALHIALIVSGVQAGDEVLVSDLTFISPANAIRYVGAYPVFIDAEPAYWQMDPEKAIDFLNHECRWDKGSLYNRVTGRRVKAILPVHILGHPVYMDPILEVARKYDLVVIEDATESLGAKYKGRMVGTLGDIACFSFNGNKIITTGGGGMIVTNNEAWAHRARYLTTQAKDDPLEYVHNEVGYNYRLTNLQAAMGVAQMEQLDIYIAAKRQIADYYGEAFKEIDGITPMRQATWAESVFWLYTVLVDENRYGMNSRTLLHHLQQSGVQSRPLWQPMHRSRAQSSDITHTSCEHADQLQKDALSLPSSTGISEKQLSRVVENVRSAKC